MSCIQSMVNDFGKLFLDSNTSDIVLICKGEEIRAHRLVLGARSPVFHAMLQSKMMESTRREIKIDDADNDVLKEMLRYMYTARVEDKFNKFRELLVVADKYQVLELVKYCGTKLAQTLNNDNAFQMGSFAETHNAEDLMNESIQFIMSNVPDTLNQDWRNQIKDSPKMTQQMLQNLLDDHTVSIYEIDRAGKEMTWINRGHTNAIAFQVDMKLQLRGIGLYGSKFDHHTFIVDIKVFDDANQCLIEETKRYKSIGSFKPIRQLFSKPITVEANKKYHVTALFKGGSTYAGTSYKQIVPSDDKDPFTVTFSESEHDTDENTSGQGQFPSFYFLKYSTTI